MSPWIMITLVMAGIVFGLDYLFRKKKWKENSKGDIISLLIYKGGNVGGKDNFGS